MFIGDNMGNRIQYKQCGEILESKYRHDFQMCSCPNQTFVDGGNDYCRYGGADLGLIIFLDEETEDEEISS